MPWVGWLCQQSQAKDNQAKPKTAKPGQDSPNMKLNIRCGVKDCSHIMTVNSKLNKSWISLSELSTLNDRTTETTVRFMMRKHYDTEHNEVAYPKEIEKTVRKKTTQEEESESEVRKKTTQEEESEECFSSGCSGGAREDEAEDEVLPGLPKILPIAFPAPDSRFAGMQSGKPEQPVEQKKTKWAELPKAMQPFCNSVERSIRRRVEIMPEMDKQNKLVVDKFTTALAAIPPAVAKMEKEIQVGPLSCQSRIAPHTPVSSRCILTFWWNPAMHLHSRKAGNRSNTTDIPFLGLAGAGCANISQELVICPQIPHPARPAEAEGEGTGCTAARAGCHRHRGAGCSSQLPADLHAGRNPGGS